VTQKKLFVRFMGLELLLTPYAASYYIRPYRICRNPTLCSKEAHMDFPPIFLQKINKLNHQFNDSCEISTFQRGSRFSIFFPLFQREPKLIPICKNTRIQFLLSREGRCKTSEAVVLLYNIVRALSPNHCNMSTRKVSW
jgi:hypothetical protein